AHIQIKWQLFTNLFVWVTVNVIIPFLLTTMKTILITLAACFIASAGYSQNSTNPCSGLVADFTAQADLPVGGVHFTDASQAIGTTPFRSHWDLGTAHTSTEKNPSSLYDDGVY